MADREAVLVLAGGGGKGALQGGAEEFLREEAGYRWTAMVGTSVGAINGSMIATGQERALKETWFTLTPDTIEDMGGLLRKTQVALGWKRSLGTLRPLQKLLEKHLQAAEFFVPFRAGVTDLETGRAGYNLVGDPVLDVLASATMPVIWEPVQGRYVDGGLRDIAPVGRALEFDAPEVVVMLTGPLPSVGWKDPSDHSALDDLARTISIMTHEIVTNDLRRCQHTSDRRITVIAPEVRVGGTRDFTAETARRLWDYGRTLAENEMQLREAS